MKIQITAPSGVTLLTEKTYCPENIDVIPSLQDKTVTPGEAQTVTPDTGYAGLSGVNVEAVDTEPGAATPSAAEQVITPPAGKFFDQFTVNAAPLDEAQTVTAGTTAKTVSPTGSNIGIKSVTVNPTPSETKSVTPTTSAQTVTPTSGKLLSSVSVAAIQTETKTVTAGTSATTVTPTSGKFLTSVTVNPTPTEEKTATTNGEVTPSSGKFLSKVTVNVPSITDVATAAGMNAVLVEANVGKVYRFTGTTDDTYTNGDLYEVVIE